MNKSQENYLVFIESLVNLMDKHKVVSLEVANVKLVKTQFSSAQIELSSKEPPKEQSFEDILFYSSGDE